LSEDEAFRGIEVFFPPKLAEIIILHKNIIFACLCCFEEEYKTI